MPNLGYEEQLVDEILLHHLRAAYRGQLEARREVLRRLRQLGQGCLAATLARAFAPDILHLDGWALAQIALVVPLSDEAMDDIMPWRSTTVACRAVAAALEEHTGRSWHVRLPHKDACFIIVGPPRRRLQAGGELSVEDRQALAERFQLPISAVKGPGLQFDANAPGLRECLARAEGRTYDYEIG